jgi:hypothetical protein
MAPASLTCRRVHPETRHLTLSGAHVRGAISIQTAVKSELVRTRLIECPLNKKTGIAIAKLIRQRECLFEVLDYSTALLW